MQREMKIECVLRGILCRDTAKNKNIIINKYKRSLGTYAEYVDKSITREGKYTEKIRNF